MSVGCDCAITGVPPFHPTSVYIRRLLPLALKSWLLKPRTHFGVLAVALALLIKAKPRQVQKSKDSEQVEACLPRTPLASCPHPPPLLASSPSTPPHTLRCCPARTPAVWLPCHLGHTCTAGRGNRTAVKQQAKVGCRMSKGCHGAGDKLVW